MKWSLSLLPPVATQGHDSPFSSSFYSIIRTLLSSHKRISPRTADTNSCRMITILVEEMNQEISTKQVLANLELKSQRGSCVIVPVCAYFIWIASRHKYLSKGKLSWAEECFDRFYLSSFPNSDGIYGPTSNGCS
jgi:hypothetical protein